QIDANTAIINEALAAYEKAAANSKDQVIVDKDTAARKDYRACLQRVLEQSRNSTNNEATYQFARKELDPVGQKYNATLQEALAHELETVKESSDGIRQTERSAKMGIGLCLAAAVLTGVGIAWMIIRGTSRVLRTITTSLNQGADQVASAARQVSAASQ